MEESLILLKDELCWDIEDVQFFTQNKRPDIFRQKFHDVADMRRKVGNWNKIDVKLFQHFNDTLWRRVRKGGERFQKDVRKLKRINEKLTAECLKPDSRDYSKVDPTGPIFFPRLQLKKGIRSRELSDLCEKMSRGERAYTNFFKRKQTKRNWTEDKPSTVKKKAKSAG